MIRILGIATLLALLPALGVPGSTQPPASGAEVVRAVSVTGADASTYPAFDPATTRYGVTTSGATDGTLKVLATSTDPDATILVNGRRAVGERTLTGLGDGDEVSVIFDDGLGRTAYSFVYLPADYPAWSAEVAERPQTSPEHILVTPSRWDGTSANFEAAMDVHGVPVHVKKVQNGTSMDFKQLGGGGYSVFRRPTTTPGKTGGRVVQLDERFEEIGSFESKDLVDTDSHDSLVRQNGNKLVMAYEQRSATGRADAVIQELAADGEVLYTWNSADHVDPALETTDAAEAVDYAHINSIEVMADGDILASFRHFSSVFKIAWSDRAGVQRGDIVWRLGGRHSDFTFLDDPYPSGPCAQHTATELANGNILMFDNGSFAFPGQTPHCVDPADPQGPSVARAQTRMTEYSLDESAGTARLVWSYEPAGWFALFAGSVRRLENGNTLIGWASEKKAFTTEVNRAGDKVWELKNDGGFFSYRVAPATVEDVVAPVVKVQSPAEGARFTVGQKVVGDFTCTDRGGSSLQDCAVSEVDTRSAGSRSFKVTATDGAGNTTTQTRAYRVVAAPFSRTDALVRASGGAWVGNNVYGDYRRQKATLRLPRDRSVRWGLVRLQNEGNQNDRLSVVGSRGSRKFRVSYYSGRRNVTGAVVAGRWKTSTLAPGKSQDLRVRVQRLRPSSIGNVKNVYLRTAATRDQSARDQVALVARARR